VIELARAHIVPKPWGVGDLRPWSSAQHGGDAVGEIWYERPATTPNDSSLLLKLLFTSQPLSIQVHPDDAFARSIGLSRGKSEAWYVLSAAADSEIALGLKQAVTSTQLRKAVDDGTIENLVAWRAVSPNEVFYVPAGTIHAIGAGLVIAEIQQRSDATFRLFDHGRKRELHVDRAIAVANPGPADLGEQSNSLTDERTVLVSNPHFVFEKIDLAPNSAWCLKADRETWLLVISGDARTGPFDISMGDVVFAQSERVDVRTGPAGMVVLAAYTGGGEAPDLLQRLNQTGAKGRSFVQLPTSSTQAKTPPKGRLETTK
jgi:mannose-6-phosphate isomerase